MGVILCRGHHDDHLTKEKNGYMVANVARMMGVDAAVMTLEGTGNTWVDFMQAVKALERSGIKTVQIVHENWAESKGGSGLSSTTRPRRTPS